MTTTSIKAPARPLMRRALSAVMLETGFKTFPVAWAMTGDEVRVSGVRGVWTILKIEASAASHGATGRITIEVLRDGKSRIFDARHATLLRSSLSPLTTKEVSQ